MKIDGSLPISTNQGQYKKDEVQAENFQKTFEKAKENQDEKRLMQTCKELESVFVNMMFKNMRATVPSDGFIEKSFGRETFEGMLDEKIAETLAKGQGVGLAQQMYKQLSRNLKNQSPEDSKL
ncbi:flagellar protein FlgJ [Anaerosolibacter carboniphilus]|uniref:Flagellar protein FlgJ n=1 Tax=Anaerosolibacter carboniphilus TaxID=1417629 RepID=A0A841KZM2_9FIRM|nr:rod-binding protein [Anaerosolibacter carboniphilus]MBB6216362.1 flagellar protein FlgJ [Anaerosolibacter carboniphilus]